MRDGKLDLITEKYKGTELLDYKDFPYEKILWIPNFKISDYFSKSDTNIWIPLRSSFPMGMSSYRPNSWEFDFYTDNDLRYYWGGFPKFSWPDNKLSIMYNGQVFETKALRWKVYLHYWNDRRDDLFTIVMILRNFFKNNRRK